MLRNDWRTTAAQQYPRGISRALFLSVHAYYTERIALVRRPGARARNWTSVGDKPAITTARLRSLHAYNALPPSKINLHFKQRFLRPPLCMYTYYIHTPAQPGASFCCYQSYKVSRISRRGCVAAIDRPLSFLSHILIYTCTYTRHIYTHARARYLCTLTCGCCGCRIERQSEPAQAALIARDLCSGIRALLLYISYTLVACRCARIVVIHIKF